MCADKMNARTMFDACCCDRLAHQGKGRVNGSIVRRRPGLFAGLDMGCFDAMKVSRMAKSAT
jgi:hypothetical protein